MSIQPPPDYSFAGRLKPQPQSRDLDPTIRLPHQKLAFIYQRLSTYEQVRKSIFSIQMQDALVNLAREDGYPDSLIHVEKRDLGLSGTLGQERREGLAHLIRLIEAGQVEIVYVVHASRLYRDQTLIDGFTFAELCKTHRVVIAMPNMKLNLRDKMHMRMFRLELERSADELDMMKMRLGTTREFKAKKGLYAGGAIPVGYVLDLNPASETYQKIKPYAPHADVIVRIFQQALEHGALPFPTARACRALNLRIPFFTPEVADLMLGAKRRSSLRRCKHDEHGYPITPKMVSQVITNPIYIGWWIYGDEVVSTKNHAPIIDEDTFWTVQQRIQSRPRGGRRKRLGVAVLSGLLWCNAGHPQPYFVKTVTLRRRHATNRWSLYMCAKDYSRGVRDSSCFCISAPLLEKPIVDFVIAQCSYSNYARDILQFVERQNDENQDRLAAAKREYQRLTREIENLKQNLALTKAEPQVKLILSMIDERMEQRKTVLAPSAQPIVRQLSEAQVKTIRELLTNLAVLWGKINDDLRNEFLRIVLSKLMLTPENGAVRVRIYWQTGLEQEILIHRPLVNFNKEHKWTDEERAILRQYYPIATRQEVAAKLPHRSWRAIYHEARKWKIRRRVPWTRPPKGPEWQPWEDALLEKHYRGQMTIDELIQKTGRTLSAIRSRGWNRGFKLDREFYKHFGLVDAANIRWEVVDFGGQRALSSGRSDDEAGAESSGEGSFGNKTDSPTVSAKADRRGLISIPELASGHLIAELQSTPRSKAPAGLGA